MSDRAFTKFVVRNAPMTEVSDEKRVVAAENVVDDENPTEYKAFTLGQMGRPQLRLRFYTESGVISLMTYSYLTEAVCASHQYLTLVFTNCIIDLHGRKLMDLLSPLQDARIRTLRCFNPLLYPEPAEEATVIYSIRRQALYKAGEAVES